MPKNEQIKAAFEEHLLKVLTEGEQIVTTDKVTGEQVVVRAEPGAPILSVVRAYLKDYPVAPGPIRPGATSGVLKRFAKDLPFTAPGAP